MRSNTKAKKLTLAALGLCGVAALTIWATPKVQDYRFFRQVFAGNSKALLETSGQLTLITLKSNLYDPTDNSPNRLMGFPIIKRTALTSAQQTQVLDELYTSIKTSTQGELKHHIVGPNETACSIGCKEPEFALQTPQNGQWCTVVLHSEGMWVQSNEGNIELIRLDFKRPLFATLHRLSAQSKTRQN